MEDSARSLLFSGDLSDECLYDACRHLIHIDHRIVRRGYIFNIRLF
jgi:hypothetical protein